MTPDERLERYARLAVEVGCNLQPGQLLRVRAQPEHLELTRAIAEVAYARGLAGKPRPADVMADIRANMYEPEYRPYV